jgi:CRISPR-associated protein Csm2
MANGRHDTNQHESRRTVGGDRRQGFDRQNQRDNQLPDIDLAGVRFSGQLDRELFNGIAKRCAKKIGDSEQKLNKPSQLRRFYDELVMWTTKVEQKPDRFGEYQPFILMLNAKVAYAKGRDLVDNNFVELLNHCLRQATDDRTLGLVKLFFEAFLGFYKEVRPREN